MKYEMFGDTGLTVSKLALGCGPFGSHLSEEESFKILDEFIENGGTMLDTANIYGDGRKDICQEVKCVSGNG
mgnify:CR=1 FL=1